MKITSIIFLVQVCFFGFSQKESTLNYTGKIGNLKIELTILKNDFLTGEFQGKYRYAGKEAYLNLKGTFFSPCLSMEESYKDKVTGNFFLELVDDSLLGYWLNESKVLKVKLDYQAGDRKLLSRKLPEDYASEVSSSIEGTYEYHLNFINDYWSPEQTEIGYNGAKSTVKIIDKDSIYIVFEAVCGPTYHFAIGEGVAVKEGEFYVYRFEDCEIIVSFTEKTVKMEANNSMDCGFGARAYLEHDFSKVSDQIQELSNY